MARSDGLPRLAALRIALPIAVLVAGVLLPATRWPAAAALVTGFAILHARDAVIAWLWAALIPLAVRVAWAATVPAPAPSLADCGNPLSPTAIARGLEAVAVIGSIGVLAVVLRADRASLSLRWPSRAVVALSIGGPLIVTPLALIVGPLLTGPFFGPIRIEVGVLAAIVPALALGVSNAAMEELTFRGAMMGWGAKAVGPTGALVLQAVLFGVAHTGTDFVNPLVELLVLLTVTGGGVIAGLIVRRTGSLLLPIAIHVALDVPLYYAFACRLPA